MAESNEFYRVMMLPEVNAKWEPWTVYRELDDAIEAARGLLTSDLATESEVIWVRGADDEHGVLHLIIGADGSVTKGSGQGSRHQREGEGA